ncbi:GTP-binding protein HSR1-related protein [Halothece sp. PCC 7418]|uniref:GTP-binding protein n=1 Tax=Halothece sp. (strain PCC 7418) TaxID=65093 RepID=UPI0002A05FC3|nr:GTP-binding protein [Halothece sp. PCC 7418]AFZ43461.1 GTP-binding protein HSR1-related protein [Halothece sp. PCC 7418]
MTKSDSEPINRAKGQNDELDEVIFSFEEITAEINYKQAQDSLRSLVQQIDLTAEEKSGLESEINYLTAMLDKLEQSVVQIAAFGMVGRGKSSVLNALLGENVFQTGPLHGVTRTIGSANWELTEESLGNSDQDILRVSLPSRQQASIQLIDTPGIDEVDGETRELMAHQIAKQADLILFIIAGDITKVEYNALSRLREVGKPMLLVFNKIDQYPEADRAAIYDTICSDRVKELLTPEEVVMVAASPLERRGMRQADGSIKVKTQQGTPQVQELKRKILEILHHEGKSLVALNTMLYADEVNEQILHRKLEIRAEAAEELIWKAVMTKAVAVALNPVTVLDLFTGAVVDVAMILALSRLYGIPMTQSAAIALLQKIAISMGGISASEVLTTLGLSGLKGLLGISTSVTGGASLIPYVSVAITQAGVAGVSSYAIGHVSNTYLANGASWGLDGPKAVVKNILDSLDEASILNRIKGELQSKLFLKEE